MVMKEGVKGFQLHGTSLNVIILTWWSCVRAA